MRNLLILLICIGFTTTISAQHHFTRQDTLRGTITPERAWWDLMHYHLDIAVQPSDSSIAGKNTITYRVLSSEDRMQIDLQPPLKIDSVIHQGMIQEVIKDGKAWFVSFSGEQSKGDVHEVEVWYSGKPKIARRAPWDGGMTWKKDVNGKPFVASACQGIGASVWWPCKDHMYDEPDSARISVRVPEGLMNISNGRLEATDVHDDGSQTFHWVVRNPINNYGININIGDYVHFTDTFPGENGPLSCDYYVLRNDFSKAKDHFPFEVHRTLAALEHWFGPYPFYSDGYKLVHVPYLGMEHQSSVTYGNGFEKGYMGMDLSSSGWGMKFDFIIVHESGHEWFANNITYRDIADMWIHESFTAYGEGLFVEFYYGKDAGAEYITGTRANITNDAPIIGQYGVNHEGSGDMYYKGANMLHTIRQLMDNDDRWRDVLRGLNEKFRHQTVTTSQIERYISDAMEMELKPVFDQYLRDVRIPVLQCYWTDNILNYQWVNTVPDFNIPVKVNVAGKTVELPAATEPATMEFAKATRKVELHPDYYVFLKVISAPDLTD